MTRRRTTASYGWEFIAPALLLIGLFVVVPCVWGIGMSFTQYDGIGRPVFTGLHNYARMKDDPLVLSTLKNTVLYVIFTVPLGIVLGLVVALALHAKWFAGRSILRGVYFLPTISSMAAVAFVWQWMLNPEFGLLNAAFQKVGLPTLGWLSDPKLAMPLVGVVGIWQGLGFGVLVYLSGLRNVPEEVVEAARIDGAGTWSVFRHVTWPLLMPTTMFLTIMGVIGGFKIFESVYIMTGGGPLDATRVYLFYLWQTAFQNLEMGYASALAVLLFVIVMVLTLVQRQIYGRRMKAWS